MNKSKKFWLKFKFRKFSKFPRSSNSKKLKIQSLEIRAKVECACQGDQNPTPPTTEWFIFS